VAFGDLHKQGGKPLTKLQVEDKLLLTLQYWREYRTMEHLAYEYGVVKSAVHSAMVWVENTLVRDGTFRLPGKNALIAGENRPELARERIVIEHINRKIKVFKIIAERYRNRRRRHKLRMTLLCAIHNYEIIHHRG